MDYEYSDYGLAPSAVLGQLEGKCLLNYTGVSRGPGGADFRNPGGADFIITNYGL